MFLHQYFVGLQAKDSNQLLTSDNRSALTCSGQMGGFIWQTSRNPPFFVSQDNAIVLGHYLLLFCINVVHDKCLGIGLVGTGFKDQCLLPHREGF